MEEKKTWLEGMQKQYEEHDRWKFPVYPYPCQCNRCPCCGGYRHNQMEYGRDYA